MSQGRAAPSAADFAEEYDSDFNLQRSRPQASVPDFVPEEDAADTAAFNRPVSNSSITGSSSPDSGFAAPQNSSSSLNNNNNSMTSSGNSAAVAAAAAGDSNNSRQRNSTSPDQQQSPQLPLQQAAFSPTNNNASSPSPPPPPSSASSSPNNNNPRPKVVSFTGDAAGDAASPATTAQSSPYNDGTGGGEDGAENFVPPVSARIYKQQIRSTSLERGREPRDSSESRSCPGRVLEKLHFFFMAFPVQIVMVLLTIIDIVFLVYEFSTDRTRYEILTMITSTCFMFEVLASLGHLQHNYFLFDRAWVIGEVTVVSTSFLVEYIQFVLKIVFFTHFSSWIAYLRAVRFLRVLIVWKTRSKRLSNAVRRLVSADRRRLTVGGYDLDMTYVSERVIAMSWPSDGLEGLYRNNINHVARYLNDSHTDAYRIFNLCSEREYDVSKFGYRVHRYKLDDHNPGALDVMCDFALDVDQFLKKEQRNIVIIHCKGGKGRTGTMICVHFLFSGLTDSAERALKHFGKERTSDDAGSFQGVESPSQERYVEYFATLVREARAARVPLAVHPALPVRITKLRLHFLPPRWWDVSRLWFCVIQNPSGDGTEEGGGPRVAHYISNPTVSFNPNVIQKGDKKKDKKKKAAHGQPLAHEIEDGPDVGAKAFSGNVVAYMAGPPISDPGSDPFEVTADRMPVVTLDTLKRMSAIAAAGGGSSSSSLASGAGGEMNMSPSTTAFREEMSSITNSSFDDVSCKRVDVEFDVSQIAPVTADVVLKFFFDEDDPDALHCPLSVWLNVNMEDSHARLRWRRPKIDGPHKDPKCKKFPRDFAMSIDLEPAGAGAGAGASGSGGTVAGGGARSAAASADRRASNQPSAAAAQ